MTQKTVLVTGANRGIGLATCKEFDQLGYKVIMASRDIEKAKKAIEENELKNTEALCLDVSNRDSIVDAINEVMVKHNKIDILINNAGVYLDEQNSLLELEDEVFYQTMSVNFFGPYQLMKEVVPIMQSQKFGRVVNISSGYGQMESMSQAGVASYKVSKLSLNGLTQLFAAEVGQSNIKINAICPGWVHTDMGGPSAPRSPEQAAKGVVWAAQIPENGPNGGFFRDGESIPW